MTSEFNAHPVREKYQDFDGKNKEQMPLLLADNRYPLFTTQLFEERVQGRGIKRDVNMGDLVAYDGLKKDDQEVKIILTAKRSGLTEVGRFALGLINSQSVCVNGAVNLTQARDTEGKEVKEAYSALSGNGVITLKRKDFGVLNQDMTQEQRLNHRGWRILARRPDEVPKEFAEDFEAFKEYNVKVVSPQYDNAMGFYLADGEKVPTLRAWFVLGLGVDRWSGAVGYAFLGSDDGGLVGVAPEAPNALGIMKPTLQEALEIVSTQLNGLELKAKSIGSF